MALGGLLAVTYRQLLQKLKNRRVKEGSCREFARRLGYSSSTISGWENGHRNIRLRQFIDWAQVLGFRVELVNEEQEDEED